MKKTNENLVILITLFAISIVIANVTGARTITTGLHIGPIGAGLERRCHHLRRHISLHRHHRRDLGQGNSPARGEVRLYRPDFCHRLHYDYRRFPCDGCRYGQCLSNPAGAELDFVIAVCPHTSFPSRGDVAVFHAIRDRYIAKHGSTKGGRWLWNNGSTITSQIWDTVIYAVISFGFGLGWVHTHEGRMQLIGIIIGQYLLKACLALLDTPFFYFFTRNADRR